MNIKIHYGFFYINNNNSQSNFLINTLILPHFFAFLPLSVMAAYTTEIASDKISSDNPIHQRLLKAYFLAQPYISGRLLEVGCGEGRGVELLAPGATEYVAIDKIREIINLLRKRHPGIRFIHSLVPPFDDIHSGQFDTVVSFQVIEHIKNDRSFLEEIYRVLRPGGVALLTTPNRRKTLTRNPWHVREYVATELYQLAAGIFDGVEIKGIAGNDKIMEYYKKNKENVDRITRFDILNLQYRLPAFLLRLPYDIMNRLNRNKLEKDTNMLVASITHEDYLLTNDAESGMDLFAILRKS